MAPKAPAKGKAPPKAMARAKAPVKGGARPVAGQPRRGSGQALLMGLLAVLMGGATYVVAPALFMVLATGMSPSVAAFVISSNRTRSVTPTLVALNVAGVIPVLARLWKMGMTASAATQLLRDPFMWLLMFGSALLALALHWAVPKVARAMLDAHAELQQERLAKTQKALVEEWGAAVTGSGTAESDEPTAEPAPPAAKPAASAAHSS